MLRRAEGELGLTSQNALYSVFRSPSLLEQRLERANQSLKLGHPSPYAACVSLGKTVSWRSTADHLIQILTCPEHVDHSIMAQPAIQAIDLRKSYDGAETVHAVCGINASVPEGGRVAVVGRSGSGKSTFLNLLAGLDHPTSGELTVAGRALHEMSPAEMADYRLSTIGVIFQQFQLIPQRTAIQNVEVPLMLAGVSRSERRQRAANLLADVGLEHRLNHFPYQLSGGEQQRVAIARALVNNPSVVFADEPTGNLDSTTAQSIVRLIDHVCQIHSITFLLVTHDLAIARQLCQQTLRMHDGLLNDTQLEPEQASDEGGPSLQEEPA